MVRKTKDEAAATRTLILDTAELVFEQRGVSGTSLHEIAKAAGLTRGAIYWHFQDKADLFNAMMDRATMPLEEGGGGRVGARGYVGAPASIPDLRDRLIEVLHRITTDPQMKRVFAIATHKVEYVGEANAIRDRHVSIRDACIADLEQVFKLALRRGAIARRMPAKVAAIGLHALLDGLMRNWMLDPGGFDLVKVGRPVIDAYLSGLLAAEPASAAA